MSRLRSKYGSGNILIMSIKDQNVPGKLCFSGAVTPELSKSVLDCLTSDPNNKSVVQENDKYDMMWDIVYRNTSLTSGHSTFSLAKSYFPRGKILVKLLNTVASHGWDLAAAPNFGGVSSRDDKGNVNGTVDWPVFIFYKSTSSQYSGEHLLLAVKDSNIPGKLCAAGPVGELEASMVEALKPFSSDVKSEKDSYDDDYDVVFRNTSITTGMQMMSFAKSYFPKGKVNIAILECAYRAGWRAVCAPNFGGQGDSWPCYVLRKLKESQEPPELLIAAIKDSNIPGKFCVSGKSAVQMVDSMCGAFSKVRDNADVKNEKDDYDEDHDAVCRNVHITNGIAAFSLACKYFPRGDSMKGVLNLWTEEGYQVVACPNFGGMLDSWPTFVLEKRPRVSDQMYMAVKDDNIPGKIAFTGGGLASDSDTASSLLEVLTQLCGEGVKQQLDDYDQTYELAYRNTVLTTGHATFTWSKPYWPHGYVVEMILQVLLKKGWMAAGGPNFGDNGDTWPGIVFTKDTISE